MQKEIHVWQGKQRPSHREQTGKDLLLRLYSKGLRIWMCKNYISIFTLF